MFNVSMLGNLLWGGKIFFVVEVLGGNCVIWWCGLLMDNDCVICWNWCMYDV